MGLSCVPQKYLKIYDKQKIKKLFELIFESENDKFLSENFLKNLSIAELRLHRFAVAILKDL
jgi:hypothetical protein